MPADPALLRLVTAVWGLASGLAVVAIGASSLVGGGDRPRGAGPFGTLAVCLGASSALGALASLASTPGAATGLGTLGMAALLPVPWLLVTFAALVAPSSAPASAWVAARGLSAVLGAAGGLVLLFWTGQLVPAPALADGLYVVPRGPLAAPLVLMPAWVAGAFAAVALGRASRVAPTPRTARRLAPLAAGIGLLVGQDAAFGAVRGWAVVLEGAGAAAVSTALAACAATLAVASVGWRAARAASGATPPSRRVHAGISVVVAAGLLGGALGAIAARGPGLLDTTPLWALAATAIMGYELARWRSADLPARTARIAASGVGAVAALAAGMGSYGLATLATASPAVPVFAGAVVFSIALLPAMARARRVLLPRAPPPVAAGPEPAYGRRVEAYRAALEATLAGGSPGGDAPFLASLKARLGITDDEERLLLHLARTAVLVPRHADPSAAFERLRLLGEGGGGRTWLARDRARDTLVVLKEPVGPWQRHAGVREAALSEARLAARVRHPNVVRIDDVVEHEGLPILVMEYVEGGTVADLLRTRGVLPWRQASALLAEVCRGVDAVHAAGVIHRDLKPSNVLLTLDGRPKVADFGIAVSAAGGRTRVEGAPARAGTLAYMAPELRAGTADADRRSDVYACAALLHECVYGSPPEPGAVLMRAPDVPPALVALMERGLAQDPPARFASAREMAQALDEVAR